MALRQALGRRIGWVSLALLLGLALALAPGSAVAQEPYEPNNSTVEAAGPLLAGSTYEANIGAASDRDYFFFYVTSAGPSQVTLTIRNSGGSGAGMLDAAIVDSLGSPIGVVAYLLAPGREATATVTLEPQKYFVEVKPVIGAEKATAYSLIAGGSGGAFGPYSQISSRCATGTAAVKAAKTALRRAQSKQQRAIARLRRSRYEGHEARRAARAKFRRAKARVTAKKKAVRTAEGSKSPWCFIPA